MVSGWSLQRIRVILHDSNDDFLSGDSRNYEWKLSTIPNKAAWKGILIKAKTISFENNFIKYSQMRELTTFFT